MTAKLGEGGMGTVYAAQHVLIGRAAAVKVLLPAFSQNAEIVSRFFNEARATAMLQHPGLVEIFDFGYHTNGSAFLVMELLRGRTLSARLEERRVLDGAEISAIVRQLAGAVGAAHARGIVHRDLKPENVFLVPDPDLPGGIRVKVLDFGIAKLADDEAGSVKTRTGSVMGTPVYMSPEQCRGAGLVDWRSDVYAVGCILYEMVCGRPPFTGEGSGEIIGKHLYEAPPSPRALNPALPEAVERVLLWSLAKRPEERPASLVELVAELDAALSGAPAVSVPMPGVAPRGTWPPSSPPISTTTLSGAASQVAMPRVTAPPARRSRRGITAAIIGAAAVASLAVALVLNGQKAEPTPAATPVGPSVPAVTPPAAQPAESPPTPPASAPEVELRVESVPSGADVFRVADGVRLGATPFVQWLPRGQGEAVYALKLDGHVETRATLSLARDGQATVHLAKAPETERPARERRPQRGRGLTENPFK